MLLKENNPWLGLESYSINDAYRFYGRDNDIEIVSNAIYDNFITTIYGISGAGKTSLLNAGLTPALIENNYLPIRIRLNHGSDKSYSMQVIDAITDAVNSVNGEVEYDGTISLEQIYENEKLWYFLHTSGFWTKDNYSIRPVIFIDQFEELFTKNDDTYKISSFFEMINAIQYDTPPTQTKELLENSSGYFELKCNTSRIVFIIREDFLARLEDYSYGIAVLRRNRIGIKQMNGHQALEVILKPSQGLITREGALKILSKVSGKEVIDSDRSLGRISIDTSILSLFCSELYQRAVEENSDIITTKIIEEFGSNIIAHFYSRSMELVPPSLVTYLEKHLLTSNGYRNSIALEDVEIPKLPKEALANNLSLLTEKRIIRIEETNGVARVEFTHDVLCMVAKQHRDNKKQKLLKTKERASSFLRCLDFSFILLLCYILLAFGWLGYYRISALLNPTSIAIFFLFVYTFHDKNNKQNSHWKLISSIFLSLLLIPQYVWFNIGSLRPIHIITLILCCSSIILNTFVFRPSKRTQKGFYYLLLAINIIMLLFKYDRFIIGLLVLFSFLILLPYRFTREKKSRIISIIATLLLLIYSFIDGSKFLFIALYPLTTFFIKVKDENISLKSSLASCFRFEVYKTHKNLRLILLIVGLLTTFFYTCSLGNSLADNRIIERITSVVLMFILLFKFCRELSISFREITDRYNCLLQKGALGTLIISICIFACQYIPYGTIFILFIWFIILSSLIFYRSKLRIENKSLLTAFIIVVISLIIAPLNSIGYNIFSNIKYGKTPQNIINADEEFIIIRDLQGNYGVRDRYNIIVPVNYSEILGVEFYNIDGDININRGLGTYNLNKTINVKWLDILGCRFPTWAHRLFINGHNISSNHNDIDKTPNIRFLLKNKDGDGIIWECNQHLNIPNLCTSLINLSSESLFVENIAGASDYFKILAEANEKNPELAKKVILNCFKKYLSQEYQFNSLQELNKLLESQKTITHNTANNLRLAMNRSYQLLPFVEDTSFVKLTLDTLCQHTKPQSNKSYDIWEHYNNISRYYLYGKMFDKAEEYAIKAIKTDSLLKYPYLNIIEAHIARGRYSEAEILFDEYKDDMFYQGKIYREITEDEERIIYEKNDSVSILLRYNSFTNSLNRDIPIFESCGLITTTDALEYIELKRKLLQRNCSIYDSAEDRGEYYLCRKYETYTDAEGEFYRNAYYGDDTHANNSVMYQFYMKDGLQISPAFRHYSESKDEDILLVMDEKDHKRKYIDRTSDTPMMISGEYDHAWRFSEGKAAVCVKGKLGFIDKHGKYIIEPLFSYSSNPKYGLDQYNRQLEHFVDFTFNEGLSPMIGSNGKYGLIDESGIWRLEPKFESIKYLEQFQIWLVMDTHKIDKNQIVLYGAADTNANIIVTPDKEKFILVTEDKACWGNQTDEYIIISNQSNQIVSGYSIINLENSNTWQLTYPNGNVEELNYWDINFITPDNLKAKN